VGTVFVFLCLLIRTCLVRALIAVAFLLIGLYLVDHRLL